MQAVAEVDVKATLNSMQQHQAAYLPVEQQLARLEGLCAQTVLPLCYAEYQSLYRWGIIHAHGSNAAQVACYIFLDFETRCQSPHAALHM